MGNPFDRLNSAQGQAQGGTRSLLSTNQSTNTTGSTARIGQLSIDLSGANQLPQAKPKETGINPIGVAGTILGTPIDLGIKALGQLGDILEAQAEAVFTKVPVLGIGLDTPRRRYERYKREGDRSITSQETAFSDQWNKFFNPAGVQPTNQRQAVLLGNLGSKTGMGDFIKSVADVPASLISDDPRFLDETAKKMIREGSSYEDVWKYIDSTGGGYSKDVLTDMVSSFLFDPLTYETAGIGSALRFAGRVGNVTKLVKAGTSIDEIVALTGTTKREVEIAKSLGFIGNTINLAGDTKNTLVSRMRGPVVSAVSNVVGLGNVVKVKDDVAAVAPGLEKTFAENVNASLTWTMGAAAHGVLSTDIANVARAKAENALKLATEGGVEALRKGVPEFRAASDDFLQQIVAPIEVYKSIGQTAENNLRLQKLLDDLTEQFAISDARTAVQGSILRDAARNIPMLGALRRGRAIESARKSILRSLAQHEVPLSRVFSSFGASVREDDYVKASVARFAASLGDADGKIAERMFARIEELARKYRSASGPRAQTNALRDGTRLFEIMRMSSYGAAQKALTEAMQFGGEAAKLTLIRGDAFTKSSLTKAIKDLEAVIEGGNVDEIANMTIDLITKHEALGRSFDSVMLGKYLNENPVEFSRRVARSMRELLRLGSFESEVDSALAQKLAVLRQGEPIKPVEEAVQTTNLDNWETVVDDTYDKVVFRTGELDEFSDWSNVADAASTKAEASLNGLGQKGGDLIDNNPMALSLKVGKVGYSLQTFIANLKNLVRLDIAKNWVRDPLYAAQRTQLTIAPTTMDALLSSGGAKGWLNTEGFVGISGGHYFVGNLGENFKWWQAALKEDFVIAPPVSATEKTIIGRIFDAGWIKQFKSLHEPTMALDLEIKKLHNATTGVFSLNDGKAVFISMPVGNAHPDRAAGGVAEFVYRRLLRAFRAGYAGNVGGYKIPSGAARNGVWYEPMVQITRVNGSGAIAKFAKGAGEVENIASSTSNLTMALRADALYDDLPADELDRAMVFIPKKIGDITGLDLESRIALFFDPTRLAAEMMVGLHPAGRPMRLDHVVISALADQETKMLRVHQLVDLLQNPLPADGIQKVWRPSGVTESEYLAEYLDLVVSSKNYVIGSSTYDITDFFPEFLAKNADGETVAGSFQENLLKYWESTYQMPMPETMLMYLSRLNKLRTSETTFKNPYVQTEAVATWDRLTGGKRAFSFADLFHNMDNPQNLATMQHPYKNNLTSMDGGDPVESLQQYLDGNLTGHVGNDQPTPFSVIMNPTSPAARTLDRLIAEGKIDGNDQAAIFKWLSEHAMHMPENSVPNPLPMVDFEEVQRTAGLLAMAHNRLELMGGAADARLARLFDAETTGDIATSVGGLPRLYNQYGVALESIRYAKPEILSLPDAVPTLGSWLHYGQIGQQMRGTHGYLVKDLGQMLERDIAVLEKYYNMIGANADQVAKMAAASTAAKQAAQQYEAQKKLYDELSGSPELVALAKAQASSEALGYRLGRQPAEGFLQDWHIVDDVTGNPVLRPTYTLYQKVGTQYKASDFGLKAMDELPRAGIAQRLQQFISTPIGNVELYDTAIERMRVYLGNRLTREDAQRVFAVLTTKARNQEVNVGGLTDYEVREIFYNVFGGGETAARKLDAVFSGAVTPRGALLYALENDLKIGLSSKFSKRMQSAFPSLATMAQKYWPLGRYRYNPIFNQQEALEPRTLMVLRGLGVTKKYDEPMTLVSALSAPGSFMMDNWEVGVHVLRNDQAIAEQIGKKLPELDAVVQRRLVDRIAQTTKDAVGDFLQTGAAQRESTALRKAFAVDVTAGDNHLREFMYDFTAAFPDYLKDALRVTGSLDPADHAKYLIDSHINGMLPTQIMRLGETSSRAFTFGAPHLIDDVPMMNKLIERLESRTITLSDLERTEDFALLAEKLGSSDASQQRLVRALRQLRETMRVTREVSVTAKAGTYQGKLALTTAENITEDMKKAASHYKASSTNINKYLAAKAEYGVQATRPAQNLEKMEKIARNTFPNSDDPIASMEKAIASLDALIAANKITERAPIYRGLNLADLVPDTMEIKPGDIIGMENISGWSRRESVANSFSMGSDRPAVFIADNVEGKPGIDLSGAGIGPHSGEDEVLLPRGLRVKIVAELTPPGQKVRVFKVDVLLQPDLQYTFERLSPNEAAKSAVIQAWHDIQIERQAIDESTKLLATLFETHPEIMNSLKIAGFNLGDSPAKIPNVRLRRRPNAPSVETLADSGRDPFGIQTTRAVPDARVLEYPVTVEPTAVFGKFVGLPETGTGMNAGGKTGIWMGSDGVKRYVKLIGTQADDKVSAALSEFIHARLAMLAGAPSSEISLLRDGDQLYIASKWIDGFQPLEKVLTQENAKQFVDHSVVDIILNNWDAAGPDLRNAGVGADGILRRIDFGNSGWFRAGGGLKNVGAAKRVDLSVWFEANVKGAAAGYRKVLMKAYPELGEKASILALPGFDFLEQFDSAIKALGDYRSFIDEEISRVAPDLVSSGMTTMKQLESDAIRIKELLDVRIAQLEAAVRDMRSLRGEAAKRALEVGSTKPLKAIPKAKIKKIDPWHVRAGELLAAQMNNGFTWPLLEQSLMKISKGEALTGQEVSLLQEGIANYFYKRKNITMMVDMNRNIMARSMEAAAKEQLYNPYKSAFERTLNHPFLGVYPVSYMYGKMLPVFYNSLFRYAPFTGEYAPMLGFRRLNVLVEHTQAALEDNPGLQKIISTRTPLINYLNALLPGVPTDVGASLPYWLRQGVLRQAYEGNYENIPGATADAIKTSVERSIGPLQTLNTFTGAVSQIQTFLTGDPKKSVLDEINDFLIPGSGN